MDSWLQMAGDDGTPVFVDMASGVSQRAFPREATLGLTSCVLPPRRLETSAERLARVGEDSWPGMPASFVNEEARRAIWEPRRTARAVWLAHTPCPLEELVMMAQYLGLDASLQPELMWLVDCALTPELPPGWVRCEVGETGEEYFHHSTCGLTQWEHPTTAFLTGVARRLLRP